jgi:hypothetical protein
VMITVPDALQLMELIGTDPFFYLEIALKKR